MVPKNSNPKKLHHSRFAFYKSRMVRSNLIFSSTNFWYHSRFAFYKSRKVRSNLIFSSTNFWYHSRFVFFIGLVTNKMEFPDQCKIFSLRVKVTFFLSNLLNFNL